MIKLNLIFLLSALLFLSSCSNAIDLKGVKAVKTNVQSTVATISSGTVEAKRDATLAFGMTGRIHKIFCKTGEIVNEGDVLATLDNSDLQIILKDSEKEYNRSQKLFNSSLISQSQFDQAVKAFEVAKSNYEKTIIRSPFKGIVIELNMEAGELSQASTDPTKPLIRVIDLEKRLIKGNIDEIDVKHIKIGQVAQIKIPAIKEENIQAKVVQISPYVSAVKDQDRTVEIKLEFLDNKIPIPVGASADVEITTELRENVLAVPTRSVQKKAQQKYVFVADGTVLTKKDITPGLGNYDRTEIISGIKENDIVVFPSDKAELKDNLKVKVDLAPWP